MKLEDIPAVVISQFQTGQMSFPGGGQATDLFVTGRATRDGPDQTMRLRLPPNILHGVVQTLSEAAGTRPAGQVQRLFDEARLTRVQVDQSGANGFVLTMSQKNPSQGKELPVEMFVSEDQLAALADLLNEAVASRVRALDKEAPRGPRH